MTPEGQEGQEGQPGTGTGGQGGEGGKGGEGRHGARGATGATGPEGAQGVPGRRGKYGPLYGYLVAAAIFSALMYGLLFQVRSELLSSCDRVNALRTTFNERSIPLREYGSILIDARQGPDQIRQFLGRQGLDQNREEVKRLRAVQHEIKTIPLTKCEEKFPRPFPFG